MTQRLVVGLGSFCGGAPAVAHERFDDARLEDVTSTHTQKVSNPRAAQTAIGRPRAIVKITTAPRWQRGALIECTAVPTSDWQTLTVAQNRPHKCMTFNPLAARRSGLLSARVGGDFRNFRALLTACGPMVSWGSARCDAKNNLPAEFSSATLCV